MELVYERLRSLAQAKMARESPGHTLQPTALVHEVYLRLLDRNHVKFENRRHFLAAAAEAMRRILIERARRVRTQRGGGNRQRVPLDGEAVATTVDLVDQLALNEAVGELEAHDPRSAQVVKLRYYVGLSHDEVGEVLGIATRTVRKDWLAGKTWLRRWLSK